MSVDALISSTNLKTKINIYLEKKLIIKIPEIRIHI